MSYRYIPTIFLLCGIVALIAAERFTKERFLKQEKTPIKVGILHSSSGTMTISERPLQLAAQMAIEEINMEGGLLGRELEPVIRDSASNDEKAANNAERMLTENGVEVIFGCWTSSCRKAVKPVVEKHGGIFFYPVQYEGLESSPNIFYTGATPNQQIIPAIRWGMENYGKRVYLVGSGYIFPQAANLIIKDIVRIMGGEILAERYIPLGETELAGIAAEIKAQKPDIVFSTINGNSNLSFFKELTINGIVADEIPVVSFSISEAELQYIGESMKGHYAVWGYFSSLDNEENRSFLKRFRARFGDSIQATDPAISSYLGVKLWAAGVESAGTLEKRIVRSMIKRQSMKSPMGVVSVVPDNQHLWRHAYIGKASGDSFDVVWSSGRAIEAKPFPRYKSIVEWQRVTERLKRHE